MISSAITIDRQRRDNMQGNHEAPLRCLVNNVSHYYSQESGNAFHGFPEFRNGDNVRVDQVLEAENPFNSEPYAYSNQTFTRPFFSQEMFVAPYVQPDFIMTDPNQTNNFQDKYYSWTHDYRFVSENKFPQMPPIKMFPQAFPFEVQDQEFQYFVVIDFEATCDKEKNLYPQEIIEFPSVLVNSFTGQLEASFQTYVRPAYHQHLTDFCKELTGIQQIQVDRGVPLSEAILMHDKWLEEKGIKHKNFAVVTWSNWDCHVMLQSECKFKKITKPSYFNRWINLKVPFQERYRGVRCNLKEAVQLAGLAWEGRAHCGLDDARNTARLLVYLMHQGIRLSITNSLGGQTTNLKNQSFCDFLVDQNQQSQRSKELAGPPPIQSQPFVDSIAKERYCFCGVLSSKCVIRKPGPNKGKCFFGCGKWTAARRAVCNYFVWASP